ncbi:MBL fold metallo-hydrolase [Salinarimonas soli]|uniref:MBL fold metallo-hydrolase n=1 Tax=Salinarimonas soli TaxID=1638099 RepID=A0A5B2VN87_9HYPH|nr:MBL fold metallo-hydrolase [Salinarimonas soli]KAA2241113.1 MBL fold metallo-hydrolase [Salinarimonas soli]
MSLAITILGCGSSGGVPRVGSGWGACDPNDPRNRRRRCSVLVERRSGEGTTNVLVDTSPDLREQLLGAGVTRLDAVLLTHEHADHTHGIDDLRPLVIQMRRRMPLYMDAETRAVIRARFAYCFETPPGSDYPPILDEREIHHEAPIRIEGPGGAIEALPLPVRHGTIGALGFRFGDLAYVPDVSTMPESTERLLHGLDVLVIDALRYTPHPTHYSVAEALALIERTRPARAVLTNLHSDLDYERLKSELPPYVTPAFDGLRIDGAGA